MRYIDNFLNSVTMYRLVLYGLTLLAVLGIIFSFTGILPFSGFQLIISWALLLAVCVLSNKLFARLFHVTESAESSYITASILFLILGPPATLNSGIVIALVGLTAMASKYILNIQGKHIFNPTAIAVVILAASGLGAATWWVGSSVLLLPVAIVGLLMVRKVRWSWLFVSFITVGLISVTVNGLLRGVNFYELMISTFWSGPIIFFSSIMLTEPSTTPPTRRRQIIYGALVGALYGTPFHFGPFYNAPELTLVLGNIYSYFASPKGRLLLRLKEKIQLAPLVYDFIFVPNRQLAFNAGQYLEWTVTPHKPDLRGNRRYFSIASSPTEKEIRIGVKIPEKSSTFKKILNSMNPGETLMAGHLSGDFTLPRGAASRNQTIVGIAGGIGITPFRSMVKYLIDTSQKTDMVLFYAASDPAEFVYQDILKQSESIGIKTVYVLSGAKSTPTGWSGKTGYITEEMIKTEVPNYQNALYYLSGPNIMVDAYKKLLSSLKVSKINIHTDYFPGY
jgi:ferredoxin-NADP reductase/Na+-translocating ferredoxin:NAD+ oxidoreductase RnfD subunit